MRAFRLAYDGADYYGFQRQPDVPTVEDTLFDALRDLDAYTPESPSTTLSGDEPDRPRGYAAAGRTDAGVSARCQTVAFAAPDWLSPRALNAELPADVRAWASADVPADFHATHDAVERSYSYHLYAPTNDAGDRAVSHPNWPPVSDERVREACVALSGAHDFHNLTPDDRHTHRTVELDADRDGAWLELTVTAGGFARQLVRRLVTLLHRIGAGETPLETIDRVLEPKPLPGHEGIPPAPAEPLVLADVTYRDVDFVVDQEAAASARAIFERTRIDRAVGSRVSRQLRDGVR